MKRTPDAGIIESPSDVPGAVIPLSVGRLDAEVNVGVAGKPTKKPGRLVSDPVDTAYQNFCRRRAAGEPLDADEYCERYPQFKSSLVRLLHAELYLEERFANEPEIRWPEAGETFLDFQLILELGHGAFARVFLATEPKLGDRLVALKVSRFGGAEAEVLGRNPHPNIVPVYSVTEDNATGLTAVCMPYLGSTTLCNLLDQSRTAKMKVPSAKVIVDVAQTVQYPLDQTGPRPKVDPILRGGTYMDGLRWIGMKLADALAYLHQRGICHRDLKPSNVLLSPEGEPMLLDFNLCADAKETLTRFGGTMPYMSPEQLQQTVFESSEATHEPDTRSDLFSLGVILYELATGKHPFGPLKLKMEVVELRKHLLEAQQRGPAPAHTVNPDVDPRFSSLLQRCLAWDPNARPQSGLEIAASIQTDLAPVSRAKRWLSRHPRTVLTASLVLLALAFSTFAAAAMRAPHHERHITSGTRLYQEGRFDESLAHFNAVLDANPKNADALFARGRAYQRLGKFSLAMKDFDDAETISPDGRNQASMGFCLNRMNQTNEAVFYYQRALEAKQDSAAIRNNLGFCFLRANQASQAKENLDRAIQLDPRMQAAYHNRALVALGAVTPKLLKLNPGAKKTENYQTLIAGIADIDKALACDKGSAELFLDAARMHALAARVDRKWGASSLDFLSQAVQYGCGADPLLNDATFSTLQTDAAFAALRERAGRQPPSNNSTRRIVDPIHDVR